MLRARAMTKSALLDDKTAAKIDNTSFVLAENSIQASTSSELLDGVLSGQQICRDNPNRCEP